MIIEFLKWLFGLFKRKGHVQTPSVLGSPEIPQPNIDFSGDWSAYLTQPYDNQYHNFDFCNCVTESGIHTIEAILNYLFKNRQLPQPLYDFLADTNNKYLNPQGYIELSVRYNSSLNGTTKNGLSMDTFWQCVNRDGIIPRSVYPDGDPKVWSDYYSPVPAPILALGAKAAAIFQWNWQIFQNDLWTPSNILDLREVLKHSPIQFASVSCPHNSQGIEAPCGLQVYQHARQIYNIDTFYEVLDSEFNTTPLKKLSLDFPIACAIKVSLNII